MMRHYGPENHLPILRNPHRNLDYQRPAPRRRGRISCRFGATRMDRQVRRGQVPAPDRSGHERLGSAGRLRRVGQGERRRSLHDQKVWHGGRASSRRLPIAWGGCSAVSRNWSSRLTSTCHAPGSRGRDRFVLSTIGHTARKGLLSCANLKSTQDRVTGVTGFRTYRKIRARTCAGANRLIVGNLSHLSRDLGGGAL